MKKESNNNVLSKRDIDKLRKAYNNNRISDDYLKFDVLNIMKCEGISKEKAMRNILKLVNN